MLHGIMNGVDYASWNPAGDTLIPAPFSAADLSGKAACREGLLRTFGLAAGPDVPVIGMVSRLAGQKGLDIVGEALPELFALDLRLVILGTGDAVIQDRLIKAQKAYPAQLGLRIAFDEKVARTIYAGSDLFLIPSRYEPCGLTQMYSLRYGTIPVVRATGGLDDSIEAFDPSRGRATASSSADATPEAMLGSVREAMGVFRDRSSRSALIRNAMAGDFSWDKAAGEYLKLYAAIAERLRTIVLDIPPPSPGARG